MSQITFDEEDQLGGFSINSSLPNTKESRFNNFLVNNGIAKDAKSANVILIVIALLFFAMSIFFFMRVFGGNNPVPQNIRDNDPLLRP